MNIRVIQSVLDVLSHYGEAILFDIERFENALNDEAIDLMDECYLIVQGVKLGIFEMMFFDQDYHRQKYVEYIQEEGMNEEEALFIVGILEECVAELNFTFQIANIDQLLQQAYQGQSQELFLLAQAYYQGFGVVQDYEKSFEIFQYLYSKGDESGAYYLGCMYENGYGIEKDIEKALMYYSSHDDDLCCCRMGTLYMLGQYVEKDENLALECFYKSQQEDAYLYSGIILEKQRRYSDAFQAYLKGAELYQSECLYKVGIYLYKGIGTELDQKEAYRYLKYAYYCLHGDSAYQLSMMFFDGIVVDKNIKKAIELLKQAAEFYNQEACILLARFYNEGTYVQKNYHLSLYYFRRAEECLKRDLIKGEIG